MLLGMKEKNITIGTAGHVDHGKTTLIKALTGIDTDRLKEEKERGMTIDLGFASITLPGGRKAGIVDVPGHERFLKNMLAGATGVDVVLLVVAADEGVMPQTTEHLEILDLLETKEGIVALTKCDMVEEEWLEVVEEDIRESLRGSFLGNVPIVRVSGITGAGMEELKQALAVMVEEIQERSASGPFRLPVDRIFTLTGFGTVATGTLASGTIRVGDAVEVLPQGLQTRVRQMQVYGTKQEEAAAGTRIAVNLAGMEVGDLSRGSVVAPPGYLKPSSLLDVTLRLLPAVSGPLRSRARIRLHIGTAEILGRLKILDAEEISPGGEGLAQFVAEQPVVSARGDRFVIRSYSPMRTIGGGIVLDPNAPKRRRFDLKAIEAVARRRQGVPVDLVEDALLLAAGGTSQKEIVSSIGVSESVVIDALAELSEAKRARLIGKEKWFHESIYMQLFTKTLDTLQSYHTSNPLKSGMPREDLRVAAAKVVDVRTFSALIAVMESDGLVATGEGIVRLAAHEVKLNHEQQREADRMENMFSSAGMNVPSPEEACASGGLLAKDIFALLVERRRLLKVDEGIYFHVDAIEKAEAALIAFLRANQKITVSEFRDLVGSSRKFVLPLLQHFDAKRITRRVGEVRVPAKALPELQD